MNVCMSEMYEFVPTVAIAHADQVGGAMKILDTWAAELQKYAESLGYNVIDISGSNLTYERITSILQETKPAVLFYLGFGDKTKLIGNDKRFVLTGDKENNNLNALAGTAVVAYASYAGSQLGSDIIRAGSPAFIGFSDSLIIVSDKSGTENIFKESLLLLAFYILDGWTVGAAVYAARRDMLTIAMQNKERQHISTCIFANRKSLTYFGDPNWKLKVPKALEESEEYRNQCSIMEKNKLSGLEEMIEYCMKKDGISREEAIKTVRRLLLLGYVSTLNEKDRPESLKSIDEVGGL